MITSSPPRSPVRSGASDSSRAPTASVPAATSPPRLRARDLVDDVGGVARLSGVSLDVRPGELVAVIGASGAGKSTVLRSLAGLHRPRSGQVWLDDVDLRTDERAGHRIGFVPQDDIIHLDLPLGRTLAYAARLRLPGTAPAAHQAVIDRVLADLELAGHVDTRVRDLSGGQRKRASIAVELLTTPDVLLLDEPTSGLDPATAAEVLGSLRRLAEGGAAVVLTTHAPADIDRCGRVVVLAAGGRLVFDGAVAEAREWFGVRRWDELYTLLATADPADLHARFESSARAHLRPLDTPRPPGGDGHPDAGPADPARSPIGQFRVLTRRSAELMARNHLTATILVAAPALVIAMLATLFRAGAVDPATADPVAAIQLVYWIAFAGFFFGLTYGLLQIVSELEVVRRERSWGMSIGAHVASKVVVLLPLLLAVDVTLFAVLRVLDRLPALDTGTWIALGVAFLLDAVAGLALGLLASAVVATPAQATLALPMLCFPQVLFAGAMVPVDLMATAGRGIAAGMSNRWAFEGLGRILDLAGRFTGDPDPLGAWAPAFHGDAVPHLVALAVMTMACLVATTVVLRRRTAPR